MSAIKHKARHTGPVVTISWNTQIDIRSRVDVGVGARRRLPAILGQIGAGRRVMMIAQPYMAAHWFSDLMSALTADEYQVSTLEVPDGEACKSTETLLRVWEDLQGRGFDRKDTVVALGGGAVSDLSGFVASTYLRGLNYVCVPTTLLAQVDAAIGGKTAINLPSGKNLAGTFYFPKAVLVDPEILSTLPRRHFVSGLAEMLKYALIEETVAENTVYDAGPKRLWDLMEKSLNGNFAYDNPALPGLVSSCIKMKLSVVAKDPQESGLRRCLNLGHTLGHAIESVSGYRLTHGEAVAVGLAFALRVSVLKKRMDKESMKKAEALMRKLGLPTEIPEELSREKIVEAMGFDKKRQGKSVKFVLPHTRLGLADFDVSIPLDELASLI